MSMLIITDACSEGEQRVIHIVRGPEKPEFFAGEREEQYAARRSRMRTEISCASAINPAAPEALSSAPG